MSLLMQALRKAERAKHGAVLTEPHDESRLQLEPLETDVQKAAAGSEATSPAGAASFSLEPLEPPASAAAATSVTSTSAADSDLDADADEDIPVIPATEAMHDPVPPQARSGAQRGTSAWLRPAGDSPAAQDTHMAGVRAAVKARAAADARRAADMPHGPGASAGGLGAEPGPAASGTRAAPPIGADSGPPRTARVDDAYFAESLPLRSSAPSRPGRVPGSSSEHLGRPRAGSAQASADGAAPWNRGGAAARASASASRNRTIVLAGLLGIVVATFAYLYWRGVSSPGPGAALPPVPMPGPGAIATAPVGAPGSAADAAGAVVPGVDAGQLAPGAAGAAGVDPAALAAAAPGAGSATAGGAAAGTGTAAGAGAPSGGSAAGAGSAGAGSTSAAGSGRAADTASAAGRGGAAGARPAASSPGLTSTAQDTEASGAAANGGAAAAHTTSPVVMPTPEALAAIEDPAIRAEAIRDAAERSARAARNAHASSGVNTAQAGATHSAPAARGAGTANKAAAATAGGSPGAGMDGASVSIRGGTPNASAADVHIVRNNAAPQVSPTLQNAWSAYQAGDLAAARQQYDAALLQEPNNRDALLGSAAVATRERNGQQAAAHYVRLLELNPNDPEALSGLVALRPGDLAQAETKLKGILRDAPESGPVLFTLGNLYARQGRWSEAQQAYFRAVSAAPSNPDYAFNLAIGLDRLNQPRLAQDYYRKALALAQSAPAGFDQNALRRRLAELGAPAP